MKIGMMLKGLALAGLVTSGWGCMLRPESAPWNNDQKTVAPQPYGPQGMLTVETAEAGSPDNEIQHHERFYVYEQSGKYVTYFNNDYSLPVGLTPGKYVVVSRYNCENKRVQVEIRDGAMTYVSLGDFQRAPAAR